MERDQGLSPGTNGTNKYERIFLSPMDDRGIGLSTDWEQSKEKQGGESDTISALINLSILLMYAV